MYIYMYLYIICTILFSRLFNCCKFAECACMEVIDANPELYIYIRKLVCRGCLVGGRGVVVTTSASTVAAG